MLHNEFDPCREAIIEPGGKDPRIPGFPELCVGVFSEGIVSACLERYGGEALRAIKFCTGDIPVWRVVIEGVEIALTVPHVGAPSAIAFLENMAAWGGKDFVFFGSCGVLRHDIADGHLIVPTAAVRDEGVSYHYQPAADEIELDTGCVEAARQAMENLGLPYVEGKTWTTDGFFRETRGKMERRKAQGCVCVEMECAALAAVAQFRGVNFAEFFYAADNLDAPEWDERNLAQKGAGVGDKCMAAALETGRLLRKLRIEKEG